MTDAAPITPTCHDGVLIRGAALPLMYRSTLALIARRHRDGLAASPLLLEACRILYRATLSQPRHNIAHLALAESRCTGQDENARLHRRLFFLEPLAP